MQVNFSGYMGIFLFTAELSTHVFLIIISACPIQKKEQHTFLNALPMDQYLTRKNSRPGGSIHNQLLIASSMAGRYHLSYPAGFKCVPLPSVSLSAVS